MRKTALAALCLAALAFPGFAAPSPNIAVSQPTLRLIPGVPAAGYFNLTNHGRQPLVLTGAQSVDCGQMMMHKSDASGGMARMEDVTAVGIATGQRLSFAPGGYHLMCMTPSPRLRVGGTAKVTFKFANGATSDVTFHVVNARGGIR